MHTIRRGKADDAALIFDSWTRSLSRTLHPAERGDEYWTAQKELIATTLESRDAVVLVAERDGEILGWLCGERAKPAVLHYVYVKRKHRRQGVARDLVSALLDGKNPTSGGLVVTHITTGGIEEYVTGHGWAIARRLPWFRTVAQLKARRAT